MQEPFAPPFPTAAPSQNGEDRAGPAAPEGGEFRLRALFESMSEGFALQEILLDAEGSPVDSRFLEVNAAFERLTGIPRDQVLGRTAREAVPPGPLWGPAFGAVATAGAPRHLKAWWPYTGRHFDIFAHSPCAGQFAVLFMDITARKEAEERSRVQARILEAINEVFRAAMTRETEEEMAEPCLDVACRLTESPLGMVGLVNAQGGLDRVALRAGPEGTGNPDGMRGLPPSGFWMRVLDGRRCMAGSASDLVPEHPFPLGRIMGVPLLQGERNLGFIGLAGKAEDYTSRDRDLMEAVSGSFVEALVRKRAEAAVRELNLHLEVQGREMREAMEELDAFAYSVSHDLRAPLRHINGFTELLRKHLDGLDPKGAHYLDTIQAASGHMTLLIDRLLSFSRSSRVPLQVERVDTAALVREIITGLEADARDRRVVWEVGPLPSVAADPNLLRCVLENLLSNALKYTRECPEARIRVGCEEQGRETVFFVADNGAGFNPRHAHRLFGVFQRLHSASQYEGSGIGLANVRRIIHRHGGRTWAVGERGAGATFFFTLPGPEGRGAP